MRIRDFKILTIACVVLSSGVFTTGNVLAETQREIQRNIGVAFKAGQYERAFKLLSKLAETGSAEAQFGQCVLLWHGLGTSQDTASAIASCKKAADKQSNAESYHEILVNITAKVGTASANKSAALPKLKQLAESGDADAQWLMYRAHNGKLFDSTNRDGEARDYWFEKALASEHPDALIKEARKYLDRSKPDQLSKYLTLMEKAAVQGDAYAMSMLGNILYPHGYRDHSKESPHEDYKKATEWYRKAAKAEPDYSWQLARALRDDQNPERDFDQGLRILITLKDKDWPVEPLVELANILLAGEELPRDEKTALTLLGRALNTEYANFASVVIPASWLMGKHQSDPKKAKKYFSAIFKHQSAKHIFSHPTSYGHEREISSAAYRLAQIILGEKGTSQSVRKYLKLASDLGDIRADRLLDFNDGNKQKFSIQRIQRVQSELKGLGFKVGSVDGQFGLKTFNAIRAFECLYRKPVNGVPTTAVLGAIKTADNGWVSAASLTDRLFKGVSNLEIDCVRGALHLGANPNARKYRGGPISIIWVSADRTPSVDEKRQLRLQITELLIKSGSKVSYSNSNIFTAVADGDLSLIELLLKNGESPVRKIDGQSLMHWAAHYGHNEAMTTLEKFGAPLLSKRQAAQQRIANFTFASRNGSGIPNVRQALKDGAWINGKDARGMTALGAAVKLGVYEKGHADLIEFLLSKGANANAEFGVRLRFGNDDSIVTKSRPLNYFVMSNSATMNKKGGRAKSPAYLHAQDYAIKAMKALIENGAKIAGRDSIGRTPLHWAAKVDNLEAARMLLELGAVRSHRDKVGSTPLDYAESAEMIALLKNPVKLRTDTKRNTP